ncbi:DOMON-like domain-containing protein [Sphingomonas sabuli]|uniref:DOMON-like domain-containing protein n=1 Tax=Sphingomonas sabuli TaxID=2764186 RepID=A0A7G9L462_9SPHN|nr:DOMON-like domain-containing protein [Sphingomonas sabuli]QNM83411.1 DOMON-like domain-containing protein [Sphingomonas sabuli]
MQLILLPHPATPSASPLKLWATVEHVAKLGAMATTNIWFGIEAPVARFAMPQSGDPGRRDELWRTTCFEAFLQEDGEEAYREWNFAPSGDWAAYDFAAYRDGMTQADVAEPYVRMEDNFTWWTLGATLACAADVRWRLGLSAVIGEADGTKSYWALVHPDPEKPDFHRADCFTAKLA